jgi:DNA-binding transcriptional ArsR family regulator
MARALQNEEVFDALGNSVRREIMRILAPGPRPVGEIAAGLPVSRPAVSKHLRVLEEAQLVAHDKQGNRNVFRLERAGFDAARHWLDEFWDDALARFVLAAENTRPREEKP